MVGFYLVRHYFRPDVRLDAELQFVSRGGGAEAMAAGWSDFYAEQKQILEELAEVTIPSLARWIEISSARQRPVIQLRMQGPSRSQMEMQEGFDVWMDEYMAFWANRQSPSAAADAAASEPVFDLPAGRVAVVTSRPLSGFQQFVLLVFTLAGFLLGIGPPGGYGRLSPAAASRDSQGIGLAVPSGRTGPARLMESSAGAGTPVPGDSSFSASAAVSTSGGPQEEELPGDGEQSDQAAGQAIAPADDPEVFLIDAHQDHALAVHSDSRWHPKYDRIADRLLELRREHSCPVVLLSAARAKDASPRLAANLAISLVRRAQRVLLIEADPDTTDLTRIFDLSEGPGFWEWSRGELWLTQVSQASQLTGLTILPRGVPSGEQDSPDYDPAAEAPRWADLGRNFDVVLLYAPAALAGWPRQSDVSGLSAPSPAVRSGRVCVRRLLDRADAVLATSRARTVERDIARIRRMLAGGAARFLALVQIRS
ncbi:MAG: hypothetical protein JW810_07985 [Sedimentisphaerales bacterium]|nr:hypothetical protein [Sedimentisphaerales bacterium]